MMMIIVTVTVTVFGDMPAMRMIVMLPIMPIMMPVYAVTASS